MRITFICLMHFILQVLSPADSKPIAVNIDDANLAVMESLLKHKAHVELPYLIVNNSLVLISNTVRNIKKTSDNDEITSLTTQSNTETILALFSRTESQIQTELSTRLEKKPMKSSTKTDMYKLDATINSGCGCASNRKIPGCSYAHVYEASNTDTTTTTPGGTETVFTNQGLETSTAQHQGNSTFLVLKKPTEEPLAVSLPPWANINFANMTNSLMFNKMADLANMSDSWQDGLIRNAANVTYMNNVGYDIAMSIEDLALSLYNSLVGDVKDMWHQKDSVMKDIRVNLLGLSSSADS
ncbi:hypothetical protein M8J76_004408 [Diaphorina citri]|nr:hypothetical protein M8J76_004408 [Diaphorina citri]